MALEPAKRKNKDMWIPVEKIIEMAKREGIDLGKGDPYNRLRYYTRLGWIPHMRRLGKNLKGHYPKQTLNTLKQIQKLKEAKTPNEKITRILTAQKPPKVVPINFSVLILGIKHINTRTWVKLIVLGGILAYLNQIRLIRLYESKQEIVNSTFGVTTRKTR